MSSDFKEATEYYQSNTSFWFGKYKGIPLSDVPKDYLVWVRYKSGMKLSKSLKRAITANIPCDMRLKRNWNK